jgi:hypothetical protein
MVQQCGRELCIRPSRSFRQTNKQRRDSPHVQLCWDSSDDGDEGNNRTGSTSVLVPVSDTTLVAPLVVQVAGGGGSSGGGDGGGGGGVSRAAAAQGSSGGGDDGPEGVTKLTPTAQQSELRVG